MVISDKKIVSLTYQLRINGREGEIVETVNADSPLTFLFGSGSLLPGFEDHLAGLKTGDHFEFLLPCEEAYGEFDERSVISIPIKSFEENGRVDYELVKKGNSIPMQDGEGNRLTGVVREVGTDSVTMDFNHPMAGNNLFFSGKVTGVRQATKEEMHHGHAHQSNSCSDCSSCGEDGSCR